MTTDAHPDSLPTRVRAISVRATRKTARISEWDLAGSQLMAGADTDALLRVLETCPVQRLSPGEALLSRGQSNSALYLILEGRMRVHQGAGDSASKTILRSGEMVCDLSVIDTGPASVTAVAEIASRVLVIDRPIFWALVETSHAVARNVLSLLSERMRRGNLVAARAERLQEACERNQPSAGAARQGGGRRGA
jgi:CRP-like cAMP-binding protein